MATPCGVKTAHVFDRKVSTRMRWTAVATKPAPASRLRLLATIFDMHPNLTVASHMRKAAGMHGGVVLTYLKWLRKHYGEKGVRFGGLIGGETHLRQGCS